MKTAGIYRNLAVVSLFVAVVLFLTGSSAYCLDDFKLKPGARGKNCLTCHVTFEDKLKNPFVHTPLKNGDCTGCHNPHTSSHGKLLAADTDKICAKCHNSMIPEGAVSVHKDVESRNCLKCHDPHSAKNKFNLLTGGNELCFGCHKGFADVSTKAKFKHNPVEKGCTTCHNPHASGKAKHLLVDTVPSLCLKCHKTDSATFSKLHMNYPVAKGDCTSCHNPHGSNKGALLYDNVHMPVANKMCNQCHEEPTSPTPFKTKKIGFELCRGCHSGLLNEIFDKNIVHWSVVGKKGCIGCHSPHGSTEQKLLRASLPVVCGRCHADVIERQNKSATKHQPIQDGKCMTCHLPHSSDYSHLLRKSTIEVCGTCHNWKEHSSHPIGDATVDKRNSNLRVDCLSCHRSHGTEYKRFIPFKTPTELCEQCHKEGHL